MNITVFLLFFSFVFSSNFERERERERVYKIGYKEKQSQSYLSYFDGFLWRIFLLLRADRLYLILSTGLKKWLLRVRYIFLSPSTRSPWLYFRPQRTLSNNWFYLFFFPLTGRRYHFRFRVPANHLASTFFLPVSGDSLGLLDVTPYPILHPSGHQVQKSVFPFWSGFVTLGLTHILSCLNGHSLMACQFKHEGSSNLISIVSVGHHVTVCIKRIWN